MRTIRTTATIAEDRRLVLQLPSDVPPGDHRVMVMIDESEQVPERPIADPVREMREERIQQLIRQAVP